MPDSPKDDAAFSVNGQFNKELALYAEGKLPKGHVFRLGLPGEVLRNTGFPPEDTIELAYSQLDWKADRHSFSPADITGLVLALQEPVAVFEYGDARKAQNVIVDLKKNDKQFLVGVHFKQDRHGTVISSIRTLFDKDTEKWLNWINQGKLLYANTEKLQKVVGQQQTNLADVTYPNLKPVLTLLNSHKNVKHFYPKKEQIMAKQTAPEQSAHLTKEQHLILAEFLERAKGFKGYEQYDKFFTPLCSLPHYGFLKSAVPHRGGRDWEDFQNVLDAEYLHERKDYEATFGGKLPSPFPRFQLSEEVEKSKFNVFDFLDNAKMITGVDSYEKYYKNLFMFHKGTVKKVSNDKIALFQEGSNLPLAVAYNSPEDASALYQKAVGNCMCVDNIIPTPEEVKARGLSLIKDCFSLLTDKTTVAGQLKTYIAALTAALPVNTENMFSYFVAHPFKAGTPVPPIGTIEKSGDMTLHSGYAFGYADKQNHNIYLFKKLEGGKPDIISVSEKLYKTVIGNGRIIAQEPKLTPEVLNRYYRHMEYDREHLRVNTVENFWHNYKILCREHANNPAEALGLANSMVKQMNSENRARFGDCVGHYGRKEYTRRLVDFYNNSVKDLPVKYLNTERNGTAFADDTVSGVGTEIDAGENHKVKIGDTLKVSLVAPDLLTGKPRPLPAQELIVASSSEKNNRIVLTDKAGTSKYILTRSDFIGKVREMKEHKVINKDRIKIREAEEALSR